MKNGVQLSRLIKGRVRAFNVQAGMFSDDYLSREILGHRCHTFIGNMRVPGIWQPANDWQSNALLVDAATIMAKLLTNSSGGNWPVSAMYIEFDNSGASVDPVPTINVEDTLAYYNALNSGDPNRDYLRIPLVAASVSSSDSDLYPLGNVASFIAQTAGATGVHGNAFSAGANSAVYGGALVSCVDENDAAQDLIWSRFYFSPLQQVPKLASSHVGITWEVPFVES